MTGLTHRAMAMLRAVGAGRGELSGGSEPDLFIDGLPCCDQTMAHMLAHTGLLRPARRVTLTERVRAELTEAGHAQVHQQLAAAWSQGLGELLLPSAPRRNARLREEVRLVAANRLHVVAQRQTARLRFAFGTRLCSGCDYQMRPRCT